MSRGTTLLDEVANDLAVWIDETASAIAIAMTPQGVAPFSASISEKEKLDYYTAQLFNPDGTPNTQGRATQLQRLGPVTFAQVYRAVVRAHPDLAVPTPPPAGGAPAVSSEVPTYG